MPISPMGFSRNRARAIDFLNLTPRIFVIDGYAGYDPKYRQNIRILCTRPYHALFMKQMLIRASEEELNKCFIEKGGPHFTVINGGESYADPLTEDVKTKTSINVNFTDKQLVILGSQYAGEMKKGVFGVMHYLMPEMDALTMHASANQGDDGSTTILFGLSGTGKTTLSADPQRHLIGDDEHVWTADGIFNIEGGCYAKAIGLTEEKEPDIYRAVKYGAILENVKYRKDAPRSVDFDDTSITENTRICYPLEHIEGV